MQKDEFESKPQVPLSDPPPAADGPGSDDPMVGALFGNFRVVRKLGEGGMGVVYEARHRNIGRRAAIKVLHPELAQSQEYATRFLNEARAVNIVQHPGLVEIFEYGKLPDGTLYFVMEFLQGESLQRRIDQRQGAFPAADVVEWGAQIARALTAAHEKGIVHRDLKPENVPPTVPRRQPIRSRAASGRCRGCATPALRNACAGRRRLGPIRMETG